MKINQKIYINLHFYLFLLFIFINLQQIKPYLIFHLEYLPNDNYQFFQINTPEKIFQQIYYKNLITKIKIGKMNKNQIFFIESNNNKFYISSINPLTISNGTKKQNIFYNFHESELYNEKSSLSYNEINCKKALQNIDHFGEICTAREQITFKSKDKIITNDFPIKIARNRDDNIPGMIGLLVNDTSFNISRSLITELISEKIIDNYYWFLDIDKISPLDNKIKGNFIIGGLPHEIFPEKYAFENYRTKNSFAVPYIFEAWRIKMDKIYIDGNPNDFHNCIITFTYEFYNIIGTLEFHNIIKKKFINNLIKENK